MAYINIEVWDATGNKKNVVEVPEDVTINRIIVLIVEKLHYPKFDATGGQLLSYKFHHQATRKQLIDNYTLSQSGVKNNDIIRLIPEIVAGGIKKKELHSPKLEHEDRFARFKLINWWEQEKLTNAKILVVGAGALGNEILKNLALLGIGNIFIADMDIIENSNLSRSVLFREEDNGKKKSETAAKAVKQIFPDINVQWFHGDIICDLGMGVYDWADVVIAGLDNREARLSVNRNCWKTNTPWIDGAIEQLNGIVRVFVPPNNACYECTLSEVDWKIIKARKACGGLSRDEMLLGKVPTTPTSSSVIAGIQCQEAVKLLHGLEILESKAYIFNGLTHDSYVINYQTLDNCNSHETYEQIRNLNRCASTTTIKELIQEIQKELGLESILEFSRYNSDIIESFTCPYCKETKTYFGPLGKTSEQEAACPTCGNERTPNTFHSLDGNETFAGMDFASIGVPPYDIVVGRNGMNQIALKFSDDASNVLGPLYSHQGINL